MHGVRKEEKTDEERERRRKELDKKRVEYEVARDRLTHKRDNGACCFASSNLELPVQMSSMMKCWS